MELVRKALDTTMYCLILMDINLPGISGIEAAKIICNMCKEQDLEKPLIIGQSGDPNETIRNECLEAGMTMKISKPFSFEEFKGLLRDFNII